MTTLTLELFKAEVAQIATDLCESAIPSLFGITDGKAIGTFVEQAIRTTLASRYDLVGGSAALGIDFPNIEVDLKVTSNRAPQSSCPFRSASQKIYGLGYHLLVLVYDKEDNHDTKSSWLRFTHQVFVEKAHTGDYQTTKGIREILKNEGNIEDIVAYLEDRQLPLDDAGRWQLAERIIAQPPEQGYLTISNALQWRLQYGRVLAEAGKIEGIENLS